MTPGLHGHGATTQTTPILRRIGLGAAIERELAQQHVLLPRRRLCIARGGPREGRAEISVSSLCSTEAWPVPPEDAARMPSRNCVVVTASEEVIEESTGALVLLTSMSAVEAGGEGGAERRGGSPHAGDRAARRVRGGGASLGSEF